MLSKFNAYFLAKFSFDTAENEPAKNLQIFKKILAKFVNFANFANTGAGVRARAGAPALPARHGGHHHAAPGAGLPAAPAGARLPREPAGERRAAALHRRRRRQRRAAVGACPG